MWSINNFDLTHNLVLFFELFFSVFYGQLYLWPKGVLPQKRRHQCTCINPFNEDPKLVNAWVNPKHLWDISEFIFIVHLPIIESPGIADFFFSCSLGQPCFGKPEMPERVIFLVTQLCICWWFSRLVVSLFRPFLVGGLVAIFYFPIYTGNVIIPIDELIFFRGVAKNHQAVLFGHSLVSLFHVMYLSGPPIPSRCVSSRAWRMIRSCGASGE